MKKHFFVSSMLVASSVFLATTVLGQSGSNITDPDTRSNYQERPVSHVELSLVFDFNNRRMSGDATYSLAKAGTNPVLLLDVGNGLVVKNAWLLDDMGSKEQSSWKIDSASQNQKPGKHLQVQLKPTTNRVLVSYYTTVENKALMWLDAEDTHSGVAPMVFADPEPVDARCLVPMQDTPQSWTTWKVTITVPKGFMALTSSEVLPEKITEDGVYHFELKRRMPSYLFSLAVGKFTFYPVGPGAGMYCEAAIKDKALGAMKDIPTIINICKKNWGEFPWEKYTVLFLPSWAIPGAMENPGLTHASTMLITPDGSLSYVFAHEIAHELASNRVPFESWSDLWVNEGLAEYIAWRILEELRGKDYTDALIQNYVENALGDKSAKALKQSDLQSAGDAFNAIAYMKGALFFYTVERTIGRERMDAYLRSYFTKTTEPLNSEEVLALLRSVLSVEEQSKMKMEQWVYEDKHPESFPLIESSKLKKIKQAVVNWSKGGGQMNPTDVATWGSVEWEYFFEALLKLKTTDNKTAASIFLKTKPFFQQDKVNCIAHGVFLLCAVQFDFAGSKGEIAKYLHLNGRPRIIGRLYRSLCETGQCRFAEEVFTENQHRYFPDIKEGLKGLFNN